MKLTVNKEQIIEGLLKAAAIIPAKAGAQYLRSIWLKAEETPWRGHSAFVLDDGRVLHATGHHGAVVVEVLAEAAARYAADGFAAPLYRRL